MIENNCWWWYQVLTRIADLPFFKLIDLCIRMSQDNLPVEEIILLANTLAEARKENMPITS
jgi:hypothetical protein